MRAFLAVWILALVPLHGEEMKQEPHIIVGGQVRVPGPVRLEKKLTVYAAIQTARGVTEFGSIKRVKILRNGEAAIYDLTDDKQKLTPLKPGDIVEVPQKTLFGR